MTPPTRCKVPVGLEGALRACGVAPGDVLALAGLPPDLLAGPGAALPVGAYFELWRAIRKVSDDPGIGIALARAVRTDLTEPYFLAVFSCATLGAAVEVIARYKRILSPEDVEASIDRASGEATITYRWPGGAGPPPQALVDAELAFLTELARRVAFDAPLRIELATPVLDTPSGHAAYYACPIRLGAPHNTVVLASTDLERPLGTHNPALLRALLPYLRANTPTAPDTDIERVRSAITQRLPAGTRPTVDTVARDMAMSGRSLQRLLREHGTSFRDLLDEIRHDHARAYLGTTSFSDAEIAFLLGFGDPASFYRAFRAWTGMSPGRYRQQDPQPGTASINPR
ncbi:MAG TPA: AraC family transcriptional regulator [Actinophytocola sp.]|uniref:AraC family transcriptional regulator n=1 Tax=Actinophytocola sp. TaxID=1872138 RepID=UPI002DB89E5E|nr:AraC family transcriptional regulator [Actinophytocola sp.]HEU5473590.1 AraC family transcriptional regulator [Actinophytocola sp.]